MSYSESKYQWNKQFSSLSNFIYQYMLRENKSLDQYSSMDIKKIEHLIKHEFYDKTQYKWQIKKAYKYCESPQTIKEIDWLINFLRIFFNYYYSINKTGKKGAFEFLLKLENTDKTKLTQYRSGIIPLKEETEILEFIIEMKVLKRHLNISHNNFVKFISNHFRTNLTPMTLRKYYFDNQL